MADVDIPSESATEIEAHITESWWEGLAPILIGAVIDLVDLITLGPVGIAWGWLVGGVGTFVVGTLRKVPMKWRVLWSLVIAAYCSLPGTSFMPAATVLMVVWKISRKKQA